MTPQFPVGVSSAELATRGSRSKVDEGWAVLTHGAARTGTEICRIGHGRYFDKAVDPSKVLEH